MAKFASQTSVRRTLECNSDCWVKKFEITHSIARSTSGHFLDKKIAVLLFNEEMSFACQFQEFHRDNF